MAAKHQILVVAAIFLQLLALTSFAHGKSVTGDKSSNATTNATDPFLAEASDNNLEFQGVSASASSGSPPPQPPSPGYNVPNPSYAAPVPASGYNLPPPPQSAPIAPFPGPGIGFGFPAGFGGNVGLDINAGGYYPIVEKAVVVVGGGVLLLVILAIIQACFAGKAGYFNNWGHGLFADSLGSAGGISGGVSASASVSKNAQLSSNVANSIDKKF